MARNGDGLCLRSKTWCLDFTHRGERHVARLGKNISRTVLQLDQPKAEDQSAIDQAHRLRHQAANAAHEAPPIDRADLVEENDGVRVEPALRCPHQHFGGIEFFIELGGDRGDDGDRARAVRDIVLKNQRWARLSDLGTQRGIKGDEVHFAAKGSRYLLLRRHASSSSENQSATSCRSRSARRAAPSRRRLRSSARPRPPTYRRTASAIKRLRSPFAATRSIRRIVSSGRVMFSRRCMALVPLGVNVVYTHRVWMSRTTRAERTGRWRKTNVVQPRADRTQGPQGCLGLYAPGQRAAGAAL